MLTLLPLMACSTDPEPDRYFPLEEGTRWIYSVTMKTMDGEQELRQVVQAGPKITNTQIPIYQRRVLGGPLFQYAVDDQGITRLEQGRGRGATLESLVLPANREVGNTWAAASQTSALQSSGEPWESLFKLNIPVVMEYAIAGDNEVVETGVDEFENCLLIEGTGEATRDMGDLLGETTVSVTSREWYAPGVGLVRMERTETSTATSLAHGEIVAVLDGWTQD